jgi:putative transposase
VYKGGVILSRNRLFHKEKAKAAAILTKGSSSRQVQSRHLDFLSQKHDCFVRDMMHKISTDIIRFCREHEVGTIVIGTNPLWKQKSKMDAVRNQNFEGIPHAALRWMITYKAQTAGIRVVLQEESYTSKADVTTRDRMPVYGKEGEKEAVFSGKRVGRGRYRCADGSLINADCNGAANILRKAFPDAWDGTDDFRFLAYPGSVSFRTLNRSRAAA